jgi:excisionase family DNA binding protein
MSSNIEILKICEYCGQEFTAKTTVTRFCSDTCAKRAYKQRARRKKIDSAVGETKALKLAFKTDIKGKDYLSVTELCLLVGVSRRTIYRMIQRKEIPIAKFGARTIIQRSAIDSLFLIEPKPVTQTQMQPQTAVSDWIGLSEVQEKYNVSPKALNEIIKRNNVPRLQDGIFALVSGHHIESIFNPIRQ